LNGGIAIRAFFIGYCRACPRRESLAPVHRA
jgi:hypothetical protein